MSFYRKNRNNDNYREVFLEKKLIRFQVSDKSFQSATIVSSLTITVFAFILFISRKNFSISESDIQTISGITAGLCGFALAIPLFLKDFDITSNFWRQFYLIAITFLVATFIGVISFLLIDDLNSINVALYLWFFLSIVISINILNIKLLWNKTKFKISLSPIFNLSISYFALFLSLFFSKGDFWIYATTLFTIYGFYLTLTLMLAILVELFFTNKKTEDNDTRIKKAIQHLAEKYKERALDEQTLLDKLKSEEFSNEQEIISRTKVQDLVAEMDSETANNNPKITIFEIEYDKTVVIPRWRKEYDEKFKKTDTTIFIRAYLYESKMLEEEEMASSEIYEFLSENTDLSKELLKENNCISRYCLLNGKVTPDKYCIKGNILIYLPVISNVFYEEGEIIYLNEFNGYAIETLHEYCEGENFKDKPIKIILKKSLSEIR